MHLDCWQAFKNVNCEVLEIKSTAETHDQSCWDFQPLPCYLQEKHFRKLPLSWSNQGIPTWYYWTACNVITTPLAVLLDEQFCMSHGLVLSRNLRYPWLSPSNPFVCPIISDIALSLCPTLIFTYMHASSARIFISPPHFHSLICKLNCFLTSLPRAYSVAQSVKSEASSCMQSMTSDTGQDNEWARMWIQCFGDSQSWSALRL